MLDRAGEGFPFEAPKKEASVWTCAHRILLHTTPFTMPDGAWARFGLFLLAVVAVPDAAPTRCGNYRPTLGTSVGGFCVSWFGAPCFGWEWALVVSG